MASETDTKDASRLVSFLQNEENIITYMAYTMLVWAILLMCFLIWGEPAAYGRYVNTKFGMLLNGNFAWFVQELPAFAVPVWCVFYTDAVQLSNVANNVLVGMMILHYFQRTFIYSLMRRGKPTPIQLFIAAFIICMYNGYMQGRYLTHFAVYETNYHVTPKFLFGCTMFVIGMAINIQSDRILNNLRKPGETGYKIPRGGMFDYISGANFFGESLEWMGYAVACWNLPAFVFAIFTLSNIGPRALHHHKFYKEKFEDYPPERKAFIPFLL
ncbi:3-oxo-5-alpha-steroid 4-dehydrogenase 1-like isoform X2 [Amphiura filiformis]|uniref:3-oxo-5-alpha-steroid 4-dehydrogenase 1-like isoform X1 n=1 Tax=Amphiura filiformis TaxID=82378 RepID=UPI003B211B3C